MPDRPNIIDNAAELIGNVNIIPIITETAIPIKNGCNSVASLINVPRIFIPFIKYGPVKYATVAPITIVTNGVTIISIFVFPDINLPHSAAITTAINAPNGSPESLTINFPCSIR